MFRDDMAVINRIIKGRHMVVPEVLQKQTLQQLLVNHMDIEKKTKLLVYSSIYWIGMNVDIENHIKIVLHVLFFTKHNHRKNIFIRKYQASHGKY